jgi:tetratricopeptide (TPR) repeat protein
MKAMVILLIVAFVGGIGIVGIGALNATGPTTPTGQTGAGTAKLDQIGQKWQSQIQPLEQQAKAKPNDYTTLKTLGDQYYDYALEVKQAAPSSQLDIPIWQRSTEYYRRALAVKPGDPNVGTDMAITQYNAQDANGAVTTIETVIKQSPKFPQAWYNAGIFYEAVGQNAKAVTAFETYLKLDPKGQNVANANQFIGQLKGRPATSTPSGVGTQAP